MSLDCSALNVTECLVQAADSIVAEIRRGNNEFNWDPLSFVVTALIGMVALLFAGLTIVQGFLTLGPGKHKCSEYAIGSWAQYSTHRWDMSEMRFRSEARTPILDCAKLVLDSLRRQWRQGDHDSMGSGRPDQDSGRIKLFHKKAHEYFPATWLAFLNILGLDHPHFFNMKVSGPDYMPSDLTAAPAYASVRDMYSLCAMMGAEGHRLRIAPHEGGLPPSMHSETLDLSFRHHPLLGTYGVVQMYGAPEAAGAQGAAGAPSEQLPRVSLQRRMAYSQSMHFYQNRTAQAAILLANGYIPQHKFIGDQVNLMKAHCIRPLSEIQHPGRHWRAHVLNRLSREIHRSHDDESLTELECCPSSQVSWPRWCTMTVAFSEASALIKIDVFRGGLQLLGASITNHCTPQLFPIRTMDIGMRLLGLISLSRFWSLEQTARAQGSDPNSPPQLLRLVAMPLHPQGTDDEHEAPREGDIFSSDPDVFALCRKYIKLRGWQDPLWELPRERSKIVAKELDRIDRWLGIDDSSPRASPRAVACRWLSLSCTLAACRKVSPDDTSLQSRCPWLKLSSPDTTGEKSFNATNAGYITPEVRSCVEHFLDCTTQFCDWFPSHSRYLVMESLYGAADDILGPCKGGPQEQEVFDLLVRELRKFQRLWTADAEQHPLDDILIYRAILVAMRLSVATDNSSLVDNEGYLRVVPIL